MRKVFRVFCDAVENYCEGRGKLLGNVAENYRRKSRKVTGENRGTSQHPFGEDEQYKPGEAEDTDDKGVDEVQAEVNSGDGRQEIDEEQRDETGYGVGGEFDDKAERGAEDTYQRDEQEDDENNTEQLIHGKSSVFTGIGLSNFADTADNNSSIAEKARFVQRVYRANGAFMRRDGK